MPSITVTLLALDLEAALFKARGEALKLGKVQCIRFCTFEVCYTGDRIAYAFHFSAKVEKATSAAS